jgi:hypothetical protein
MRTLLEQQLVCVRGYVNRNALKTLLDQPDFERNPSALLLIRLSCLELWLRDLEQRQAHVGSRKTEVDVSPGITNNGRARVAQVYS